MSLKTATYHALVQRHKDSIYCYSLYLLRNRMDAEDVTQEALIRIWKHFGRFNLLSARSWIMRTTHNLCIDLIRKREATQNREHPLDVEYSGQFADSPQDRPARRAELGQLGEKIQEAIQKLPEKMRSVFVLYELQGLKMDEISKALDIPVNTVKVTVRRARLKLQEELRDYA